MELREGDVFSWKFKNDEEYRKERAVSGTAYWAMDRQCVFQDGKLCDTHKGRWNGESFDGLQVALNHDAITIDFKCNLNDVREISKFEIEDYDKVYDCSYYSNYRKLYLIDADAKPSKKALAEKYRRKIEDLESTIKSLQYDLERAKNDLSEVLGE